MPEQVRPCVQKIRVYDTRDSHKAQITLEAHSADVNVISWNALTTFMLASGGDDSHLKVWDLRALDNHIASFNYHSAPVTSIEWCPHESSMLATCSEVCLPFSWRDVVVIHCLLSACGTPILLFLTCCTWYGHECVLRITGSILSSRCLLHEEVP